MLADEPVSYNDNNELEIYFKYIAAADKQEAANEATARKVLTSLDGEYKEYFTVLSPTGKLKERTVLDKYINLYTSRNSMDYFIHKDLKGFLSRELDFYIKNEIFHLDNIDSADNFV